MRFVLRNSRLRKHFCFCVTLSLVGIYLFYTTAVERKSGPKTKAGEGGPRSEVHIALACCGTRKDETIAMVKSAVLFSSSKLVFHIFTEELLRQDLSLSLDQLTEAYNGRVSYILYELWFPNNGVINWKFLFRPCASQRLFLHRLMNGVDAVLYVDTDTIFLTPPEVTWSLFEKFSSTQIAGMTQNVFSDENAVYETMKTVPQLGNGFNTGVILLNLTRLRAKPWEDDLVVYYRIHIKQVQLGDQDLINIYFFQHPDEIFSCPCETNYRPIYCSRTHTCQQKPHILHGNQGTLHNHEEPAFMAIYSAFHSHKMEEPLQNLQFAVWKNLNTYKGHKSKSKCGDVFHNLTMDIV